MHLENEYFKLEFSENGSIVSFIIKDVSGNYDLIGEKRLASNFKILAPEDEYMCNYIDGKNHIPVQSRHGNSVRFQYSGLHSEKGYLDIDFTIEIILEGNKVIFRSELKNNSNLKIAELWYPQIGGIKDFYGSRNAKLQMPESRISSASLFKHFPAGIPLGGEAAEFSRPYPGMSMPWHNFIDEGSGNSLYMGYHDPIFRYSTFLYSLYPCVTGKHDSWLTEKQACGEPVGILFSHIRFPYTAKNEMFNAGEFVFQLHSGDPVNIYEKTVKPVLNGKSWMGEPGLWLAKIPYEEGKTIEAYDFFKYFHGDVCYEFVRLPLGNLDEDTMYNRFDSSGLVKLTESIHKHGGKIVIPMTFNMGSVITDFFKKDLYSHRRMDGFGDGINYHAYGFSRILSMSGKVYGILEKQILNMAKCGVDGVILDKLTDCLTIDLNPKNQLGADEALCEGVAAAIYKILVQCRQINPGFCLGGECINDRLARYFDMIYIENVEIHKNKPAVRFINTYHDVVKADDDKIRIVSSNIYRSAYKGELWKNAIKKLGGNLE